MSNRTLLLAALMLGLTTPLARAHALGAECKAKGDKVQVEAYYSDGTEAADAAVTVLDGDKKSIAAGRTDKQGRWEFAKPSVGTYQVVIDAGGGHRKELRIAISEKGAAAAADEAPCCCCDAEPKRPTLVSDGPTRSEFTRFPWLKAVMGCSLLGMVGLGFWFSRHRSRNGSVDAASGEEAP